MKKYRNYDKHELKAHYGRFFASCDWKNYSKPQVFRADEGGVVPNTTYVWIDNNEVCGVEVKFCLHDLKTGHVIELKDGEKYVVLRDPDLTNSKSSDLIAFAKNGWLRLDESAYRTDMTCTIVDSCDIMKVNKSPVWGLAGTVKENELEVIYCREDE